MCYCNRISASISFRFLVPVGIDPQYPEKQRRVAPYISGKESVPTKYHGSLFGRFKMRYVAPILLYFLQLHVDLVGHSRSRT